MQKNQFERQLNETQVELEKWQSEYRSSVDELDQVKLEKWFSYNLARLVISYDSYVGLGLCKTKKEPSFSRKLIKTPSGDFKLASEEF